MVDTSGVRESPKRLVFAFVVLMAVTPISIPIILQIKYIAETHPLLANNKNKSALGNGDGHSSLSIGDGNSLENVTVEQNRVTNIINIHVNGISLSDIAKIQEAVKTSSSRDATLLSCKAREPQPPKIEESAHNFIQPRVDVITGRKI